MTRKEFDNILKKNNKAIKESMSKFEDTSKEFNRKIKKILTNL